MRNNTDTHRRAFILPAARVYVPGSAHKETYEAASESTGGGCCGSAPAPSQEEPQGCGTSNCGADSTTQQPTSCC